MSTEPKLTPSPNKLTEDQAKVRLSEIRSEQVESWLRSRGANFTRAIDLPLALVDERQSRANQARPTALVDSAVDRYAAAMKAGQQFPPIVVYRVGGEGTKFVIVDGNNRHAASKRAGRSVIAAYVLVADSPSELIELLTVESNARHGEPVPTEWRVRQAIHLCSLGWSRETACDAAGVSTRLVTEYTTIQRGETKARQFGIKNWNDLAHRARYGLSQLTDERVFQAATMTALNTAMNSAEVADMVRSVKAADSEANRIRTITRIHDERKARQDAEKSLRKQGHKVSSPKHNLVSGIGKIVASDPDQIRRAILTELEKQELKRRLAECAEHILNLQIAVDEALKDYEITEAG